MNPTQKEAFIKLEISIRGQVLRLFTVIEAHMDKILRNFLFDNEQQYDSYMNILQGGEIPMGVKVSLFKICIEKYEKKFNKDLNLVKIQLSEVVNKRNIIAHWQVDITPMGQQLFINEKKIKFIKFEKASLDKEEVLSLQIIKTLESNMIKIFKLLHEMDKTISASKPQ
jgi:hypothetical protein